MNHGVGEEKAIANTVEFSEQLLEENNIELSPIQLPLIASEAYTAGAIQQTLETDTVSLERVTEVVE
jgi:hypothetical protein